MATIFGGQENPIPASGGGTASQRLGEYVGSDGPSRLGDLVGRKFRKRKNRTFRIGGEPFDPKDMRNWIDLHAGRPNYAGNAEWAATALDYVKRQKKWHEDRSSDVRAKWEILDTILRGESLSSVDAHEDIHVAHLHRIVEQLVPAILEAILQYDPWFVVEGRDEKDRRRTQHIREWLHYCLQANRFEQRVEEWVRCAVVYQMFAIKNWWSTEFRDVVATEYEESEGPDGTVKLKVKTKDQTVLAYEGPRMQLIDPNLFIWDSRVTEVQDMEFVGDRSFMFEDQLLDLEREGRFMNVSGEGGLLEHDPRAQMEESDFQIDQRSLTSTAHLDRSRRTSDSQPRRYEVTELYCKFRPAPDMPFQEWRIVTAGDTHVLELRRNPHHDQHRPYAVGRIARSPFDFLNVGVLDHAIPLQIEFDDHRRLCMRGHRNAVAPTVWVGDQTDAPQSLWHVEPGRVYRSSTPPTPLKLPTTVGEMQAMEAVLRRDMEEVVGAPPLFDGGGTGAASATEFQRRVEERNRRIRRMVYAVGQGMTDLLQQIYQISQQFMTPQRATRVLNQGYKSLQLADKLGPEDFADPVDIRIEGLRGLQQNGLRATQHVQFLTQYGPLLAEAIRRGNLNLEALINEGYASIVGRKLDDQILKIPPGIEEIVPPYMENLILEQGGAISVHPMDDDAMHIRDHEKAMQAGRFSQDQYQEMLAHVTEHRNGMARKDMQRRAASEDPVPPFQPGQPPQPRAGTQDGRYDQPRDMLAGQQRPGGIPGETPGPADPARMAAMDRAQAVPQERNQL